MHASSRKVSVQLHEGNVATTHLGLRRDRRKEPKGGTHGILRATRAGGTREERDAISSRAR